MLADICVTINYFAVWLTYTSGFPANVLIGIRNVNILWSRAGG